MDNNYEQPSHKDSENRVEEEEEEEKPLPIPGPQLTHESEHFSNEQSLENTNYELERCLGEHLETVIEEAFKERTTPEHQ